MSKLSDTFAGIRTGLEEMGIPSPSVPLSMRDQITASFRSDLVSLGIDTAEDGMINAAIAGLAVGTKMLIQQGVLASLLNHYVSICECLLPMIDTPHADLSSLGDMDFLKSLNLRTSEPEVKFACSKCGGSDAVVAAGPYHFCVPCAGELVFGGMTAMRLAGPPQVGGPGFQSAHTGVVPGLEGTDETGVSIEAPEAGGTVDTPPPSHGKHVRKDDE